MCVCDSCLGVRVCRPDWNDLKLGTAVVHNAVSLILGSKGQGYGLGLGLWLRSQCQFASRERTYFLVISCDTRLMTEQSE